MGKFRLTGRAEKDLIEIYHYTLKHFGLVQAERYTESIKTCLQMLATSPMMGRAADHIRVGVRRHEHAGHVIFYRQDAKDTLILAIIHGRMRPDLG